MPSYAEIKIEQVELQQEILRHLKHSLGKDPEHASIYDWRMSLSLALRDMIVEDIRSAQSHDDKEHVQILLHVLHHFLRDHPEAVPVQHPWSGP